MARGGRLPRAAGRPPRFLRTGHQRAISLSEAHLTQGRAEGRQRHTLGREAEGVLQSLLFHRASQGLRAQRATFRILAVGDPDVDAALASAVGCSPPPRSLTPPRPPLSDRGAVLREAAALPRLSGRGRHVACERGGGVAGSGCVQKPRRMRHQQGVRRPARATSRVRRSAASAPRSSRVQETFLTSAVRWRELKGRSPGLSVDFPGGPYAAMVGSRGCRTASERRRQVRRWRVQRLPRPLSPPSPMDERG